MRKEIITARKNEAEAVRENKTIIATLSHDIKTPLASIRAYAEGLEANLESVVSCSISFNNTSLFPASMPVSTALFPRRYEAAKAIRIKRLI